MKAFIKLFGLYIIVGFIFTIPFLLKYYKNRDIKIIIGRLKAQTALIVSMLLVSIFTKRIGYRDSYFIIPHDVVTALMINVVYLFITPKKNNE
ncbi:MAG: hypothetical protein GXY89_03790 [Tissierellia bacterium]|jgi:hypothetical protein|nr:hypothetical protein [Tissierellia bacterium]